MMTMLLMITLQGWCSELGVSIGQEHVWNCLLERSSLLLMMMDLMGMVIMMMMMLIERYLFLFLVITSIRIILGSFPCFAWGLV